MVHLSLYARSLTGEGHITRSPTDMLLTQLLGSSFARQEGKNDQKKTQGRRKHRDGQPTFRTALVSYYNCQNGDNKWWPVLGQWVRGGEYTAAHIVPYSFPPRALKFLLLPEDADSMADALSEPSMVLQNGLYLYTPIEDVFDHGKLVIVPRLAGRDHIDFKVQLLDEGPWDGAMFDLNGQQIPWRTLDGKSLVSQNNNRPGKNFLFLQILLTIMRKYEDQPPNWAHRLTEFIDPKEPPMLSPHPHLVDGPLVRLSRLITDEVVFQHVRVTIPDDTTILPDTVSEQDVGEVNEELDSVTADILAINIDLEDDDRLFELSQ